MHAYGLKFTIYVLKLIEWLNDLHIRFEVSGVFFFLNPQVQIPANFISR